MAYHSVMIPGTDQTATGFIEYEDSSGDYFQATAETTGDEFCEVFDPLEFENVNAGSSQKKRRRTKSKDITLPSLEPYYQVLPLDTAAKMFGVGRTTFRTRCRELGIREWPYKKRNVVNTVRKQQREIKKFLMDINTCPEMDYEAVGRNAFWKRCHRELEWPCKKRNVNTVHDQLLREVEVFLMDIDTCHEIDYEAAGNRPTALEKIMHEFKALIDPKLK